jgi:hypothetical protein
MVEIVYEEIICFECGGQGSLDGEPCPEDPRLCESVQCPRCGGSGSLRQALIVQVDDLPLAA